MNEPDFTRQVGTAGNFTVEVALRLGFPGSMLCVLANDESQVEAGRLTGSHGNGGFNVVACWKEVAKSRSSLGTDI